MESAIAWKDFYIGLKKYSFVEQMIDLDELIFKKTEEIIEINELNEYASSPITIGDGNKIFQHDEL